MPRTGAWWSSDYNAGLNVSVNVQTVVFTSLKRQKRPNLNM